MTTKNPEIKTREEFCEFLQEILCELRDHSPNWYYCDIVTYLDELLLHMSNYLLDRKDELNIPFSELATMFDGARRGSSDE
jgi:hypothetical protein